MVFERGEGLEEIRIAQEKAIADFRAEQEKLRIEKLKIDLLAKANKLKGKRQGQCVIAVRKFIFGNANLGRDEIQGSAKNLKINSKEPELESIVLIDTKSKHEHVAVVLDYTDDSLLVYDSNYVSSNVSSVRRIPRDKKILGYRIIKI